MRDQNDGFNCGILTYLYFIAVRQNYSLVFFEEGSTDRQCGEHLQKIRLLLKKILVEDKSMGEGGAHMNSILDIMYPRKDPLSTRGTSKQPTFNAIPDGTLLASPDSECDISFTPEQLAFLHGHGTFDIGVGGELLERE